MHGLAVDGKDLAELDEVVGLGTAERAEAELGDDFTDVSRAGGAFGSAAGAGTKRVGGTRERCKRVLAGKNSGGVPC